MKKSIMLIACLLVASIACFSATYPKVIILGDDTVVVITRAQERELVKLFIAVDDLRKEINLLKQQTVIDSERIAKLQNIVKRYERLIANYKELNGERQKQIDALESEVKYLKRLLKLNGVKAIAGGVTGGVSLGAIGFVIGFFVAK